MTQNQVGALAQPWVRIAPALAALAYPALVWTGPAVSPGLLAASLLVPAAGVAGVHRSPAYFPRARSVALLTVATPPLYSWLGGLLDFQTAVPLSSLTVWYPLWAILAVVAGRERPRPCTRPRPARLTFAHGCSAGVIAVFAIAHVANHLAAWWGGGELHMAVMGSLRTIYRSVPGETVLLAAVTFQILSGLRLLFPHAERGHSWWNTAQIASGAYLAVFFLSHLTAALRARWLRGIDTNWQWLTADSMVTDPWSARLAPYYFLAVVAFGVHAGLGLRYVLRARGWPPARADLAGWVPPAIATVASIMIMAALLGA
jgi:succinate dehydrogenase/fumarate reductase cytochrome b subunit